MNDNKLKIAIITAHQNYFAWHDAIFNQLKNSPFVDLVLNLKASQNSNLEQNNSVLWKLFLKIDSKFFNPKPDALSKIKTDDSLNKLSTLNINENLTQEIINKYNIDIIINLTEHKPNDTLLSASKYGIWFFNHCDLDKVGKRPYGIWEMLNKIPETVGTLRYIKKGMDYPETIDSTSSCTDSLSYKRNINAILWQTHLLLLTNIELLAKNEAVYFKKVASNVKLYANKVINAPYSSPSNTKILGFGVSLYLKKLVQLIKSKFYFNQWALIFLNNENKSNPYNLETYTQILPPKDRFWADPFLIKKDNKYYLFIEELIYKNKLGHLSVMEIDKAGNYTKPQQILVKDYHLSYPNVFEDNGDYYMIPETSGNNDIQLYKSTEFPLKWKLEKVLMNNVIAVDTTVYKENDTYWMFTNMKKNKGGSKHAELFLFSSKRLLSDNWTPHPLNPIVSDIKTARPAGALFKVNNKLYRPSQNCSKHYGYGLNISEITKLDANNFEEIIVSPITPDWDKMISCTHSFNSVDKLFISDIKIKRKR